MLLKSTSVLLACIVMTSSSRDSRRAFSDYIRLRRNECADVSGQCFSTAQCCEGLVCASFDDYFGQKPEAPGVCVKEKDLQSCGDTTDCDTGSRCVPIGRSMELYCLPGGGGARHAAPGRHMGRYMVAEPRGTGSLGSQCQDTSECRRFTSNGQDELCCKDTPRGRLGTKRQCDRVDTLGDCIGSRN